jgi:2-dehydro-3-deoxygluconokinase
MENFDVVTLGEAMLRLSPPGRTRLEQATSLDLHVGGAELSVAFDVARLGLRSSWVTKLPRNALGRRVVRLAREQGVDVSHVIWSEGDRVGIYFLEFGAAPRSSVVIYDRKDSAASKLRPGEVDWSFLKGARLFHVSGITPALSDSCREATMEAVKEARNQGCKVSLDMNYRSKLWSPAEAGETLAELARLADLVVASDAEVVWGIKGNPEEVLRQVKKRFNVPAVAMMVREAKGTDRGTCGGIALSDRLYKSSRFYELEIVDRVGAGDSFMAGLAFGYLRNDMQMGVEWGAAMAAMKHSIPGDANYTTKEEVEELISSGESFRVQR